MLKDNKEADNRVIIFSTPSLLAEIATAKNWASDGTFKICPVIFYQVYVIRVELIQDERSTWVTVIYALLQRKTRAAYEYLFRQVQLLCQQFGLQQPRPIDWMMDFELPAMNAARDVFNILVRGCLFHLTSNGIK
jgi:MULE transposase domain